MAEMLPKAYSPGDAEPLVRERWDQSRVFHATVDGAESEREPFCILIPPPNVTAALHLGHALNNTLQDVLTRYHRMCGCNTLWMPGTDHAGIATQTVVEKRLLQEEGKRRTDYSREEFVAKVQEWKDEYEATITEQLKAMGCSCDWERQRFTMDDVCAKAVREAFFRLFRDGLIYRGKRLVNWDPVTQTALADDEVEMEEVQGYMYYLRYPLVHSSENPDDPLDCQEVTWSELAAHGYPGASKRPDEEVAWVTVATTRPETYLGDTAVAVNPKDPRAAALRGLCAQLPLVGRVIPIIEDEYVVMPDAEAEDAKARYATGFLKVTPAHDPNDYEIGQRHAQEIEKNSSGKVLVNVLAPDATISDKHGWEDVGDAQLLIGLSREEAREKVVAEFEARGLFESKREYTHSVGHSYRSHVPIEPYLSDQWYVKVTDDRLVGEAQRALVGSTGVPPVRDDDFGSTGVPPVRQRPGVTDELTIHRRALPHWQLGGSTYFLTFCLKEGRRALSPEEQLLVLDACFHWHGSRAHVHLATVMPDHVHLLISPLQMEDGTWHPLPDLVQSIKGFTSHEIQRARGSSGKLWQEEYYDRIIRDEEEYLEKWNYIVENPVRADLVSSADDYEFTRRAQDAESRTAAGASHVRVEDGATHGRDARATGDGELHFFPARYAKTYQQWHANLRDWCISRQLWWGHRIPVWHKHVHLTEKNWPDELLRWGWDDFAEGNWARRGIHVRVVRTADRSIVDPAIDPLTPVVQDTEDDYDIFVCIADELDWRSNFEDAGFVQDPDVLDTWFSSALWPISTMGWPEPGAFPREIPEGGALLETFNPSTVLCTGRDIITLWVSRMVMFNRYFRDGKLPFRHVYINPMIQDGHGQRMSKSLGNGVDPRDIIHSHGADAMRYVLVQLATSTQDVRMPVDMVCPHCEHTFHPQETTSPAGYRVAAPEQTCPRCAKKMTSAYGAASGLAKVTKKAPLARNTSSRFDLGRNFCNKLWNAARFALGNLGAESGAGAKAHAVHGVGVGGDSFPLTDKWIIARLHRTLHKVEDALAEYQFNIYADAMYDFIWRDFCDWYLEAIKPTIADNPAQQQVLGTVLNAALRLLHPICPFVTETLWPHVVACGFAGLEGIKLPPSDLLATAPWPDIKCSVDDKAAHDQFARLQTLIETIRTLRGDHKVNDRRKITLFATDEVRSLLDTADPAASTLAGFGAIRSIKDRPSGAVAFAFEAEEQALGDLADEVDTVELKGRLKTDIEKLRKQVEQRESRLSKPGYVEKAPAHLVEQTRDELRQFRDELAVKQNALDQLDE